MTDTTAIAVKSDASYELPTAGMAPGLAIMFNDKLYERCKDIARTMAGARGFTPPHLLDKPHGCFAVVTNAITWKLNPFAVAQSTYETPGGKVGYEGKLVQAILENSGMVEGPVTFEHFGDWSRVQGKWKKAKSSSGKDYAVQGWDDAAEEGLGVIVRAKVRGEHQPREFTMFMRECFPRNSTLWALRPSQQICYTAVRAFANMAAPGIFMGVPFTTDLDAEQMVDVTPSRPTLSQFEEKPKHDDAATEIAAEEYSVADAYEAGREAKRKGHALKAVPPEWRDNPAFQAFVEGWTEGWKAEDAESNSANPNTGELNL